MADNRVFTPAMIKLATQKVDSPPRRLIRAEDRESGCVVVLMEHKNGAFTVVAEHKIPPDGSKVECECEPEHSVAKLGHCLDCPAFKSDQPNMLEPHLIEDMFSCPPRHFDLTPHDFDWATYADERLSTGVCRCGLSSINLDLMVLP